MADDDIRVERDALDPHAWTIEVSDDTGTPRRVRALGVRAADGRVWVSVDGDALLVEAPEAAGRGTRHAAPDQLSSPMPATVVSVHVAVGDRVAAGDPLIVLEAMKMELPLTAPHAGVITGIACEPGALVQPHVTLVTIEDDRDDDA